MTPEEIVNHAVDDYESWGPTPAWPTVGGWVVAMLDSFGELKLRAAADLPVQGEPQT